MPKYTNDELNLIVNDKATNINGRAMLAPAIHSRAKAALSHRSPKVRPLQCKMYSKIGFSYIISKKYSSSKSKTSKVKKIDVIEYYDLPYRYNETVVKVLAQTPNILFVYWDISDEDKQHYIEQYGDYFFNDTKPVLIVYNITMNYSFEIDINDFANSWYLHISDSNCDYRVELGRRPINKYSKVDNYLFVSSSNNIEAPNDHILFDSLNNNVYFRNVKTNVTTKKDISLSSLSRVGKIYNVNNFYKNMYKDEYVDFDRLDFKRLPSS